jgi:protein transport protein SEC24
MLVVSDLDEPFAPIPYDLVVVLSECRPNVESFLKRLPSMHLNSGETSSALGKAMQSAERLIVYLNFKYREL